MGTAATTPPAPDDLSFERALERLETLVARLEDGELELELEDALAVFEEGVGLSRRCASQLEEAERRIQVLVEEGSGLAERPFEPDAGDETGDDDEADGSDETDDGE